MVRNVSKLVDSVAADCALFAPVVVGGVDVEEMRLAAQRRDVGDDLLDVRHRLAAIEMDAEDVVTGSGELARRGFAEAARSTEDQGPTGCTG